MKHGELIGLVGIFTEIFAWILTVIYHQPTIYTWGCSWGADIDLGMVIRPLTWVLGPLGPHGEIYPQKGSPFS